MLRYHGGPLINDRNGTEEIFNRSCVFRIPFEELIRRENFDRSLLLSIFFYYSLFNILFDVLSSDCYIYFIITFKKVLIEIFPRIIFKYFYTNISL